MAQDSTRRLLKVFGIAVTNLEDALEAALAEGAKKAEAELPDQGVKSLLRVDQTWPNVNIGTRGQDLRVL